MIAGNYPQAISTLRKAVSTADPSSLTYAYGLYDLGVALLKSGDAASAVPVLEQRLKIPNQTDVVQQTLNQALQATGQAPPARPSPGHGQGKGNGKGKGRGHGHDGGGPGPSGGAGLTGPGGGGDEHSNFVD
jgi:tetratricopeptide (TPR) repeat protein